RRTLPPGDEGEIHGTDNGESNRHVRETMPGMTIVLTGNSLTLADVLRVARGPEQVELHADVAERVRAGRSVVEHALEADVPVYGLITGVGVRKRTHVGETEMVEFNRRLILEPRVGQGEPAPDDVVRAQLLMLANSLARG